MIIVAYFVLFFAFVQLIVAGVNFIFRQNWDKTTKCNDLLVSVLIPARNEEANIGNLLSDLLHQDYKNIEIIIFNDQSTDKTLDMIATHAQFDTRIRVVESQGLPDGWLGKNFACHSLSMQAKGKYILFLDADVRVGNNIINNVLSYSVKHQIDLVSIFPKQIMLSIGEKLTVPNMNYILLSLLPLPLVQRSKQPSLAAANGQFMFFEAENYKTLQPHMQLRNNKVEDIAIAQYFKQNNRKIACTLGNNSIRCRMYTGFNEAVNGFSKNITAFFGHSFVVAISYWFVTTFGFLFILISLPIFFFGIYLSVILLTRIIISKIANQSIFENVAFCIPQQIAFGIFIYKALQYKSNTKLIWKGREIN